MLYYIASFLEALVSHLTIIASHLLNETMSYNSLLSVKVRHIHATNMKLITISSWLFKSFFLFHWYETPQIHLQQLAILKHPANNHYDEWQENHYGLLNAAFTNSTKFADIGDINIGG